MDLHVLCNSSTILNNFVCSTDVHFQDGLVLHQFPAGYKVPEVPFYAIKWAVMGSPGPVWERDVCWLEYGDIFTDEVGNEVGFGVVINFSVGNIKF